MKRVILGMVAAGVIGAGVALGQGAGPARGVVGRGNAAGPATAAARGGPATLPARGGAAVVPARGVTSAVVGRGEVSGFEKYLRGEIAAGLDSLQGDATADAARVRLTKLFEVVVARGTANDAGLFRDADFARRLAGQVGELAQRDRRDLLIFMRSHEQVARALVFLLPDGEPAGDAFAVLEKLRAGRAAQLENFATLTAAICAVHARPLVRNVNEVAVRAPDPLAIFDYFVANERSMVFGVRNVPAELLAYVVDTTVTIEEMRWALAHYNRDQNIGRHFFDVHYDYDYFELGKTKLLNQVAYTLPNILQVGGVCADQAYFAVEIGKAIGVPTAYTRGASGESGHAWVGFVQAGGPRGGGGWNFDTGRYEEFKGVRGLVVDPLTRQSVPDAFVSFTAELINTKPVDRQTSAALVDAARRLIDAEEARGGGRDFGGQALPAGVADAPPVSRRPGIEAELELLAEALRQNPGEAEAWMTVGWLAKNGKLTLEQKKFWSDELLKQCGQKYPDFAVAVVSPMIATVEDPVQQNALWNAAFERFKGRFDLAATIRMEQAAMWEKQQDNEKAGACYLDVIDRYANAGPFVLTALVRAEDALPEAGKAQRAVVLYEGTWAKCKKPDDMAGQFSRQSNWYRVGTMLVQRLAAAGNTQRAGAVQRQLDPVARK